MCELQEMLEDPPNLAPYGVALVLAQILDLLGNVLAVESVVAGPHRTQHVGLVLRPGIEIVVVSGSVAVASVGHDRSSKALPILRQIQVGSGASSAIAVREARRVSRTIGTHSSK